MDPKARQSQQLVRSENARLRLHSFDLYRKMLSRLLHANRQYAFLEPLSIAVRQGNWVCAYSSADFLSKQTYLDATSHLVANQFSLLIKKYPWDPSIIGKDPLKAAENSFYSAEKRCGLINRKFKFLSKDPSRDVFREEGKRAMHWIRSLLGSTPDYRSIFRKCEFGQGASVGVHGDATHIVRKLSSKEWSVTPGALHHAFGGILHNWHYLETLLDRDPVTGLYCYDYESAFKKYLARITVVNSNKISFVPKTAATHRSVAVEPLMNGFYQKGIDLEMRRKLRNFGIDLSSQALNQRMAREGSLDDSEMGFVTLDLKGASNSVSIESVRYLLPPDWFYLLDRTRSHYMAYGSATKRYEMFCSMGNGFCFPLETLIFAAICHGCGAGVPGVDFMVYGDDIIVRRGVADRVIKCLKHYGYSLNMEKSFVAGPFRESCGADWFRGEDVRPFTLDYALDKIDSIFKFCNLTQRSEKVSSFFSPVRALIIGALSEQYRFFRPVMGSVDSGIDSLGDEHLTSPHCVYNRRTGMWKWRVLLQRPYVDFDQLWAQRNEPWLMGVALRGSVSVAFGQLRGLPEVVFRRKTRSEVAWEGYSSTSNWLPTVSMLSIAELTFLRHTISKD
jgi:hypothetical protein